MRVSKSLLSLSLIVALAACTKPADPAPAADAAAPQATTSAAPAASTVAQAPADTGESSDGYVLTMDNVDAMLAAQKHLAAAEQADPSLDSAMNASEEDGAQYAARLEATPALRDAIAKAGMTTRDYAMTSESLIAAMMTQGAIEAGQLKDIPDGIDPQTVEFVREHKAELDAKFKALQQG
jgi:hypothetical protein